MTEANLWPSKRVDPTIKGAESAGYLLPIQDLLLSIFLSHKSPATSDRQDVALGCRLAASIRLVEPMGVVLTEAGERVNGVALTLSRLDVLTSWIHDKASPPTKWMLQVSWSPYSQRASPGCNLFPLNLKAVGDRDLHCFLGNAPLWEDFSTNQQVQQRSLLGSTLDPRVACLQAVCAGENIDLLALLLEALEPIDRARFYSSVSLYCRAALQGFSVRALEFLVTKTRNYFVVEREPSTSSLRDTEFASSETGYHCNLLDPDHRRAGADETGYEGPSAWEYLAENPLAALMFRFVETWASTADGESSHYPSLGGALNLGPNSVAGKEAQEEAAKVKMFECLLSNGVCHNAVYRNNRTLLHQVALGSSTSLLEVVLRMQPASINEKDSEGMTPLMYCARARNTATAELLMRHPEVKLTMVDTDKRSFVHHASACNGDGVLQLLHSLQKRRRASTEEKDDDVAEEEFVTPEMLSILLNGTTKFGQTPLHNAIRTGNRSVVQALLECPNVTVAVNATNKDGSTPLHFAARYPEIWDLLIQAGADDSIVNVRGATPLSLKGAN